MDNTFVRLYWLLFRSLGNKTGSCSIRIRLLDDVPQYFCMTLECTDGAKVQRFPVFIRLDALMQLSDNEVLDLLYDKVDSVPEQGEQDA